MTCTSSSNRSLYLCSGRTSGCNCSWDVLITTFPSFVDPAIGRVLPCVALKEVSEWEACAPKVRLALPSPCPCRFLFRSDLSKKNSGSRRLLHGLYGSCFPRSREPSHVHLLAHHVSSMSRRLPPPITCQHGIKAQIRGMMALNLA